MARFAWRDGLGVAVASEPARAFLQLHTRLVEQGAFYGHRDPSAIDASTNVHPKAHVDECGVRIGPRCPIEPGAVLLEGSILEGDVRVMAGPWSEAAAFRRWPCPLV